MSTAGDAGSGATSSAVPADLRAYSQAAMQIDQHIHELALRLGHVLDAYRASRPEFGHPIPRIEDDLELHARRCLEIDKRVGQIAAAFERAGTVPQSGTGGGGAGQPVVVAEAAITAALEEARRAAAAPPPPKKKEHHDHALLGGLIHAVEHPGETLSHAASAVEHAASDALGTVERGAEHPGDTAAALATGAEHLAGSALHGLESLGGGILHAIEHPMDTLSSAEQAAEDFVTGFATGVKDMAQAAMLLARVIPGTPMWMASMAVDPAGTVKLQEQFAKGLAHIVEHPVDALGNMIDVKDLQSGDYAKWLGHLTPDVIVTVLTMGGGGAAAVAGEGVARTAGETTAEQVATSVAEDAAKVAGEGAVKTAGDTAAKGAAEAAARDTGAAAEDAGAGAREASGWRGPEGDPPPPGPEGGRPPGGKPERWPVDDSGYRLQARDIDFLGLTRQQIDWLMERQAPLGMTPEQFSEFRSSLLDALRKEGIDPAATDIRLHGSASSGFSGIHKTLPTEAELAGNPEALGRLREWLADDPNRPLRRPFDSMHRLGLEDVRSDYDLNISNDRMVEIARSRWDPTRFKGEITTGHGYLNKVLMNSTFPELTAWSRSWSQALGRDVSHAVFPGTGPLDTTGIGSGISVHFQETDWIVHPPSGP